MHLGVRLSIFAPHPTRLQQVERHRLAATTRHADPLQSLIIMQREWLAEDEQAGCRVAAGWLQLYIIKPRGCLFAAWSELGLKLIDVLACGPRATCVALYIDSTGGVVSALWNELLLPRRVVGHLTDILAYLTPSAPPLPLPRAHKPSQVRNMGEQMALVTRAVLSSPASVLFGAAKRDRSDAAQVVEMVHSYKDASAYSETFSELCRQLASISENLCKCLSCRCMLAASLCLSLLVCNTFCLVALSI
jgi:hypothetical protein